MERELEVWRGKGGRIGDAVNGTIVRSKIEFGIGTGAGAGAGGQRGLGCVNASSSHRQIAPVPRDP